MVLVVRAVALRLLALVLVYSSRCAEAEAKKVGQKLRAKICRRRKKYIPKTPYKIQMIQFPISYPDVFGTESKKRKHIPFPNLPLYKEMISHDPPSLVQKYQSIKRHNNSRLDPNLGMPPTPSKV